MVGGDLRLAAQYLTKMDSWGLPARNFMQCERYVSFRGGEIDIHAVFQQSTTVRLCDTGY
jgi:hypothetical protein